MKLHCVVYLHSPLFLPANALNIILYKASCYRKEESEISIDSTCHSFLTASLHLSVLYFATFYENKMKRSPWHLTLFLHCKTAFLFWHFEFLSFPCGRKKNTKKTNLTPKFRVSCLLIQMFSFHGFRIKHFCQETVSINWTSLPYIQGDKFHYLNGRTLLVSLPSMDWWKWDEADPGRRRHSVALTILWPHFTTKKKMSQSHCSRCGVWNSRDEKQRLEITSPRMIITEISDVTTSHLS